METSNQETMKLVILAGIEQQSLNFFKHSQQRTGN